MAQELDDDSTEALLRKAQRESAWLREIVSRTVHDMERAASLSNDRAVRTILRTRATLLRSQVMVGAPVDWIEGRQAQGTSAR